MSSGQHPLNVEDEMGPPLIILQLMMTVTFFMAITGFLGFACWSWLGTRELTRKHGTHISTGSWTGFRIIIIPEIILGVSVNSRNSRHRRRRHGWGPAATRRWWSGAGLAFVCQYYAKPKEVHTTGLSGLFVGLSVEMNWRFLLRWKFLLATHQKSWSP